MASLGTGDRGKGWRITWTEAGDRQACIRLGAMPKKLAEGIKVQIEWLVSARASGQPIPHQTAKWLDSIDDRLHAKIAKRGLCAPRVAPEDVRVWTLRGMLDAFVAERKPEIKPASLVRLQQGADRLLAHFDGEREPQTIGPEDAKAWRTWLLSEDGGGYSKATVSRDIRQARSFWRWGIENNIVKVDPFAKLKAGSQVNHERQAFVSVEDAERVIDACPDWRWRTLIALSRYGGLRVPSEAVLLRWSDIDWGSNTMRVRSPKTEHHEGKDSRVVPIFGELLPYLLDAREMATEGEELVVPGFRTGQNLNPQFRRIVERAGVEPWPRLWHNMRGTRQTELAARFPLATVCQWLGNSKLIAAGHYLQTTDADWERAVAPVTKASRKASQKPAVVEEIELQPVEATPASTAEIAVCGVETPVPSGQSRT